MDIGAFSVSLAVRDLAASRSFYSELGFSEVGGNADDGWLILRNGSCTLGLFQGMFERNLLTFNPGWDANGEPMESFMDVREVQKRLKARGIAFAREADETSSGPESCVLIDPDGNQILIDQHV